MATLRLGNWPVKTVFHLLGQKENDITYSIGWGLAHCDAFAEALLDDLFPSRKSGGVETIELQKHGEDGGFTDIEIHANDMHVILEAKRGWNLPGVAQLKRYCGRLDGDIEDRAIVVAAE